MLGEEVDGLTLARMAPKGLPLPGEARRERAAEVQGRIAGLKAKIDAATENLMFASDPRTRQVADAKIKALWEEHDLLARESGADEGEEESVEAELARMVEWWSDFRKRCVHVPVDPAEYPDLAAFLEAWGDGEPCGVACDARAVNECLHQLGCEVTLQWRTDRVRTADGRERNA